MSITEYMGQVSPFERKQQIERLKTLEPKAGRFQSLVRELWWHSTNGYGLLERENKLYRLRGELTAMVSLVDECLKAEPPAAPAPPQEAPDA